MDAAQTTLSTALLIAGAVAAFLLIYFWGSVVVQQRRRLQVQRRYFLNETAILEEERSRIARDLHDEVGPLLTVALMRLRVLYEAGCRDEGLFRQVDEQLSHLTQRIRGIAVDLSPSALERKGLKVALENFLDVCRSTGTVQFELLYSLEREPEAPLRMALYRMVQEAVHNALKHSEAKRVAVGLTEDRWGLCLQVVDDGQGFDLQAAEERGGLGLRSLRSRVELLGGKLDLRTGPGKGTDYRIDIPHTPYDLHPHTDRR